MPLNLPSFLLGELNTPVLACSMGAAFTIIIERCATRYRWHGTSLSHHTHTGPVPRVGGIAVLLAIFAGYLGTAFMSPAARGREAMAILLCCIPVLISGAYDDFRHLSARTKLVVQVLAGSIFAYAVLGSHVFSDPSLLFAAGMLVFWLILTTNSFNLIDGVDGLAAGTAALMGITLAVANLALGNRPLATFSLAISAACLGFLPFNLPGRRIFLGDSGSLGIGFALAAIVALTAHDAGHLWAAPVLYGLPITETALTIVRRKLKNRSIFRPDREHLHHKLRNAGLSPFATVGVLYVISAAFNCLGIMLLLGCPVWAGVAGALFLFVLVAYSFDYLGEKTWRKLKRRLAVGQPGRISDVPVSYSSEYSFGAKNSNT